VRALQDAGLASRNGEKIARSLAIDVGARIAGGPKDQAAINWALGAMKEAGLSNVHAEPVKVPHWERGAASAEVLGQKLKVLALGGSIGTPPAGLEAGVIELADMDALEKADAAALKSKIVFVNQPMQRARDGSGYGAAVRARFQGPRVAAEKGAVALVIRSIGTDTDVPHTGATKRGVKIASLALSGESADKLHTLLEANKRVRMKLAVQATWHDDADSANVIGEIPGAQEPDRIVLLGAHLDSWDVGQGAIDDGAGCGIVLEAARLVAALRRPARRTIRIALFAAEEIGVTGGEGYAKAHAAEAARHVMTMEADMGTARAYAARYLGSPDARPDFERITGLLKPLGIEPEARDAFGGADMSSLRALGVPAFELAQDFSAYFDVHHTENDTTARLDADGIAQSAAGYASVAWAAAEMNGDFGRVPEDKRQSKW
jgi:Zn-dependent M28 family amino/carboxypeptidase